MTREASPPPLTVGLASACQEAMGVRPSSPSPDSLLQPITACSPRSPILTSLPTSRGLRPLHPNPILAATVWLALAAQVLPGARLGELRGLFWLDPCSLTSHVFYPRTLGGTEYRLLHLGQSPGSQFPLGFSPTVVTWASLLAEDEADVLNNGLDSEERISVPSCYGGVGAPVSRQGENRGLRGFGSPAAGEGLREGTRLREAWTYSCLLWVSPWSTDSPPRLACTVPKGLWWH